MKQFFIFLFIFSAKLSIAQSEPPVQWDMALVKNDIGNFVQINVSLEKGWHIFAYDAGGDGLAISTTVTFTTFNKKNKKITDVELKDTNATEKPVSVNMEGFGIVNYFDKNFSYLVPITSDVYRAEANVTYQTCNDKMCLPPVNKILSLQVQPNK